MSDAISAPSGVSRGAQSAAGWERSVPAIERATMASVPPDASEEAHNWLLGFDAGTVGRAHSAVPLTHDQPDPSVIPWVEARYAAHGLAPVFRLPRVPNFGAFRAQLVSRGYTEASPTLVQTAGLADLRAHLSVDPAAQGAAVSLSHQPHEDWASVFLGPGFDPVDGAHRVRILGRSTCTRFATVRQDGQTVAIGAGSLAHGYLGIHGMRTLAPWRGRGLARQIISALVEAAQAQGLARAYLQVEAGNVGAQALYRRLGFADAWAYAYWKRPASH